MIIWLCPSNILADNNCSTIFVRYYKSQYDVLHQLAESFLAFDRIKAKTHLCLFATICVKHPELELQWDFFEKVRTKRNGIHYYATPVSEKDWKEVALQFGLYVHLLRKKIEEKLMR